jgi:hypothetical protein
MPHRNPTHHERTKHIDIRAHFIRDVCAKGIVKFKYIPTNKNPVDMLTKPLKHVKHAYHRDTITKAIKDANH